MRGKNKNALNNAWRKLSNSQKNMMNTQVNQIVDTGLRTGQSIRDGYLQFGAQQLVNYVSDDYVVMGGRGGGVVGS